MGRKRIKKIKNIVILTGTPGTGKTSVAGELEKKGFRVIKLNDFYDEGKDTIETLSDKISEEIKKADQSNIVIEGHFAHLLNIKTEKNSGIFCFVLRTSPKKLFIRLKDKGFDDKKIMENLEAEAIDLCLVESIENFKNVYEIDTTNKKPGEIAEKIIRVIENKIRKKEKEELMPGKSDFLEELFSLRQNLPCQ